MIRSITKAIPNDLKNTLKKHLAPYSTKPYVLKDDILADKKFPDGEKGGVIFTADFELAWAVRYSKKQVNPIELARTERRNVPIILDCCEKYDIPVTWATVGHLFLESCKKGDHDWMERIPHFDDHWRFTEGDWYDHDPYTDYKKDSAWYAPDLIEVILKSHVKHEFGCHTFSHIDCTNKNCPPDVLNDEIIACIEAAKPWGIKFKSFVFPGGTAGNFPVLKKHGIEIYRRRVGKYEVGYPYRDEVGILVSPTGPSIGGIRKGWSVQDELIRFKKAVNKAIKHNSLVHIWFHPSAEESAFRLLMPEVFKYCVQKRELGQLWIGTMNDIQEHINQNQIV